MRTRCQAASIPSVVATVDEFDLSWSCRTEPRQPRERRAWVKQPAQRRCTSPVARSFDVGQYFDVTKPAIDLSKLSADEKFELLDELWLSLRPEDLALTPEIRAELDRRLDRIDREGHSTTRWAEVRAKMTSR